MTRAPNFIYIGTSKAGSTWIFKALSWHPQIYMYPGKDLTYFTRDYANGWDWYLSQFNAEPNHKIIGEVVHSYLVSNEARDRIHEHLPDCKLMVCLREPVERAFSQYLDGIKNGKIRGTFEEELERTPSLINRSRYGTHLANYLEKFPRSNIHIASFDDLNADPNRFANDIFDFLAVDNLTLSDKLQGKILPAGEPRMRSAAMAAKRVAKFANRIGLSAIRAKAKTSPVIRNMLYRPFTEKTRPRISDEMNVMLRERLRDEVRLLDDVAGTDFCRKWGYAPASDVAA